MRVVPLSDPCPIAFPEDQETSKRVFVLGDSRTGTTSIHVYLQKLGFSSVHYFVSEAGISDPFHKGRSENWNKFKNFVNESGFNAFSDYPTRLFFRELISEFPEAYFILTTRRNTSTWMESCRRYFGIPQKELERLCAFYSVWNEEILWACDEAGAKLLTLCIDDGSEENATALCEFLDLPYQGALTRENVSRDPV